MAADMKLLLQWLVAAVAVTGCCHCCGPGMTGSRWRSVKNRSPLVYKQHVPNFSEQTLVASGLAEGKIRREEPRFEKLVVNYNPDIVFKDEERTGDDRIMTERCSAMLDALSIAVQNEWSGVKLRVTEAWDEDDTHAEDSLHYEGRAVDITTSDRDRAKYGMLARLAVQSGFDWVYYDSRAHIHASVKSESSEAAKWGGCFHGDSSVTTKSGIKKMWQLSVGEEVLVAAPDGRTLYSSVVLFMDRSQNVSTSFLHLCTDDGKTLTLTSTHLVFATDNMSRSWHDDHPIFAADVVIGQYLWVLADGILRQTRIRQIQNVRRSGIFAPLTEHGNVIVDNVLASCYAVVKYDALAHWAFAPVRWLLPRASSQQQGIHWYASVLHMLGRYSLPSNWLLHE